MLLRCVLCNNGSYPHAVCLFSESYVLHLFQTDASFLPRTLATNPTRSAAMIVPSRTPLRCPVNTKDRTAAITAMETSKQIFVVPKLVLHVRTIAWTKDSPGNITTSASTSMYTPNPRIRHPIRRYTIFIMYVCGFTHVNRSMVRSMKYPKIMDIGICKTCSSLKFLRRISNCSKIKNTLKKIVKFPNVNGKLKLNTYGIDVIGEVPRLALVIKLTPSEFTNRPIRKITYLFNLLICSFLLSLFLRSLSQTDYCKFYDKSS